ncbi:MAG: PAS domain S-box protein [Candidatus Omnitrophota bacterium]
MDNSSLQPQNSRDIVEFASNLLLEKSKRLRDMPEEEINTLIGVLKATESKEFLELEHRTKEFCEKYHKLYNLSFLGFLKLTNQGVIIEANPVIANWFGISSRELIGRNFCNLVHEADRALFASSIKPSAAKLEFELRLMRKDNTPFYVFANIDLLADGKEGPFLILVLIDKHKFKQGESETKSLLNLKKESEEKFRYLADRSPVGIFQTRLSGEFTYANDALARMFEFDSANDLMSENAIERYNEAKDRKVFLEEIKRKGKLSNYEFSMNTKTGKLKHILGNMIFDGEEISGIFIDITERKKTEEVLKEDKEALKKMVDERTFALLKAEEELETIFSNTHLSIAYLDKNLNFIRVNKAYAEKEGKTPEFFADKSYLSVYNNKEDEQICKNVINSGCAHSIYAKPYKYGENASAVYLNCSFCPVKNLNGEVEGLILCMVDVTEYKQMEEELFKTQEELLNAGHLSDMGTLAATVAHELRNPLAAIKLAAYNIKRNNFGSGIDKHIININKKIDESNQIINNLLFYSRIKSPQYQPLNIYEILNECINQAKEHFEKFSFTIYKKFQCLESIHMEADHVQIREMFNNILNNACEALSERDGTLEISAECVNPDYVKIYFKDTGAGIDESNLAKIFKPFFTTKAKGTGLGLSVSLHIAQLHKGNIEVQSRKYEGTTVTVVLPLKKINGSSNFGANGKKK